MTTRHASKLDDSKETLCGETGGRLTKPKELVNCPTCRVILNHVRGRYPEHARYGDWRLTKDQMREAAADMRRDIYGE